MMEFEEYFAFFYTRVPGLRSNGQILLQTSRAKAILKTTVMVIWWCIFFPYVWPRLIPHYIFWPTLIRLGMERKVISRINWGSRIEISFGKLTREMILMFTSLSSSLASFDTIGWESCFKCTLIWAKTLGPNVSSFLLPKLVMIVKDLKSSWHVI